MRKYFAELTEKEAHINNKINVLVGDLGYMVWDNFQRVHPNNYYNVGAAEQLLIGAAIGMTYTGIIPICYSITPFLLYRPYELLRTYVNYENIPIKLVGCGRNKEYIHDGISHWVDDINVALLNFPNIVTLVPNTKKELLDMYQEFLYNGKPTFLSLTKSIL